MKLLPLLVMASVAQAQDQLFWEDALSGDWSNGLAWDPDGPPTAVDVATIRVAGSYTVTVDTDPTIRGFSIEESGAVLEMNGRTMTVLADIPTAASYFDGGWAILRNNAIWTTPGDVHVRNNGILELRSGTSLIADEIHVHPNATLKPAGGNATTIQASSIFLDGLMLLNEDKTCRLDFVGDVTGNGNIAMNVSDTLEVRDVELRGVTLTMADDLTTILRGIDSGDHLSIGNALNDATVRGGGYIGSDNLNVTNWGLIDATGDMRINVINFANHDTIRASTGSSISIEESAITQSASGVIEALDGALIEIWDQPMSIEGGTLRTEGSGIIRDMTTTGHIVLKDLTIDGYYEIQDTATTRIVGTITNLQSINLMAGGTTILYAQEDAWIDGGGTINCTNDTANQIRADEGFTLTNVDNTIRGSGTISGSGAFTNQGLVVADQTIPLIINCAGDDVVNQGTMRAASSSTLNIRGGMCTNHGGVIEAMDHGLVKLDNDPHIVGGTFRSFGTGQFLDETTTGRVLLEDVTNEGVYRLSAGSTTRIRGTLHNVGYVILVGPGNVELKFEDGAMLTGGGEIQMVSDQNNSIECISGGDHFTNVDNTIRGEGRIGSNISFTNQGTVHADSGVPLVIDPWNDGFFDNQGTIIASGSGGLDILRGIFTTSGAVRVEAGSSLDRPSTTDGDYTQAGGSTTVHGTLSTDDSNIYDLQGGTLDGTGTITSDIVNTGGTVAPGASIGTLGVDRSFTQSGGTFEVEVGDGAGDLLAVTEAAALGGSLHVINAGTPVAFDEWTVLTCSSLTGIFDEVTASGFPADLRPVAVYEADHLRIVITCDADWNGDLSLDIFDVLSFLGAFDGGAPEADVNGDTVLDIFDVLAFLGIFDAGC